MKYITVFIISLITAFTSTAGADNSSIAALVNDAPITRYEFNNRKKLLIVTNNIERLTPEISKQLDKAVIQSLVDEQLLQQHIKTTSIKVSEAEIDEGIVTIEQRNKMPKGYLVTFLKERGVDVNSFREQIKSEIIKSHIISHMARAITVSQKEIDTAIISTDSKDIKLSARIFTSKDKEHKTFRKMQNLQKKIKTCNTLKESMYKGFADLTPIDSTMSRIPEQMQTIAKDLAPNQASSIFETPEGFQLILICDKEIQGVSTEENNYVTNFLINKKVAQKSQKFIEDLRKKAYIKIFI